MEVTLVHVLVGIAVSVVALGIVLIVALRSTKPLYPVRCVHCWMHYGKETVITLSSSENQWGICPDCVGNYWRFSGEVPSVFSGNPDLQQSGKPD